MKSCRAGLAAVIAIAGLTLAPSGAHAAPPRCWGAKVTVVGTSGDDSLRGTDGIDVISGRGGDDTIEGLDGKDLICGGEGADVLQGGRGADRLYGDTGDDSLRGGEKGDVLQPAPGDDKLDGGSDSDTVWFTTAAAAVQVDLSAGTATGEGTDRLTAIENVRASRFDDELTGGKGINKLDGESGEDVVAGDDGRDILFGGLDADTLDGGSGADQLRAGKGADESDGGPGSDYIDDMQGSNTYDGGPGNDQLFAGPGDDAIYGGAGEDFATFHASADLEVDLIANAATGDGTDELGEIEDVVATSTEDVTLSGADDNNVLIAGAPKGHTATVRGLAGDDSIVVDPPNQGESGDSMLLGGAGADRIEGGCQSIDGGRDRLEGGGGPDRLDGACGVDELFGGAGRDILKGSGDKGKDTLDGGPGFDFGSFGDWGNKVIANLTTGVAKIHFPGDKVSAPLELVALEGLKGNSQEGNDTLIGDDGNNKIFGLGGADTIKGKGGDDTIDGGNGRDRVKGGGGNDRCKDAENATDCES